MTDTKFPGETADYRKARDELLAAEAQPFLLLAHRKVALHDPAPHIGEPAGEV